MTTGIAMAPGRLNGVLLLSLLLEPSVALATHLDPNLQDSCYGTCDTGILSPSGACWDQLFIDGSNTCDVPDSGGTNGADGTDVADIDGDGDLDVVTGWEESGDVFVYLNPGQSSVGTSSWTKVSVAGGVTIANIEDAVFADLNADCKPESVVTAMEGGTDKVCVHQKGDDAADASQWSAACLPQSNKNFMRVQIGQLYPRTAAAADNLPESSCATQVAQDPPDCNDIVVGAKSDSGEGETLMWYECVGADKLAPESWQRHTIGNGVWFMSVWLVDMDGDEDLDVLFSDRARVGWFENPYDSSAEKDSGGLGRIRLTWDRHVIEGPGGLSGEEPADPSYAVSRDVRDMAHHDLDRDGDEDVISTVNYDLSECPPNSSATCTGDTGGISGNPGIRIAAHYYERRLVAGSKPAEGIAFWIDHGIHTGKWLQFIRHVVAVDDLPYRDEDVQDGDDPDNWISKAVEVGDVAGDGRPEVVFTARGSGHGVYYLDPVANPNADSTEFIRGPETLDGSIWHVVKVAPAYLNLEGQSEEEDGRKMKYDNLQLVDLDGDLDLDVVTSEENIAPNSRGLGVVWYRNNQVPVARCKDVVVGASANSCSVASAPIDDGSFDPDGDTLQSKYEPSGPYSLGTTSVKLTVTDPDGASASCTASVTLEDDQGPPLVCPSNQIAECQGLITPVSFDDPAVGTDNCSDVSTFTGCVPSSDSGFFRGSAGVSCSATDGTNTSGCSFTVTVLDTIAPTVTAPADIVRECASPSGTTLVLEPAQASDECDQPLIFDNAPDVFPPGTTTVTWTARDLSGNQSLTVQSAVMVVDTTPPEITCPGDLTLEPTSPAGDLLVYPVPDAEDACDANPTVECIPVSGSTVGVGTTTMIHCTATDVAGNQGLCSFSARVLSAAEMVTSLRDRVNALAGVLTRDQLKGLNDNLNNLLKSINRQQKDSACGQVMGFIVKISGWIGEGILTPAQGQPLIDSATNLSRTLGC
jgi:hypothetical protein